MYLLGGHYCYFSQYIPNFPILWNRCNIEHNHDFINYKPSENLNQYIWMLNTKWISRRYTVTTWLKQALRDCCFHTTKKNLNYSLYNQKAHFVTLVYFLVDSKQSFNVNIWKSHITWLRWLDIKTLQTIFFLSNLNSSKEDFEWRKFNYKYNYQKIKICHNSLPSEQL